VGANLEGVAQVLRVAPGDRLLGILPLFHSFGYMALWFASNRGLATVFHPNPLDAPGVGEVVHCYNITIMIATPTFLQLYLRRCTPAQFGSLRLVMAGAEKLPQRLATAFEDYFGIRPLEGYGTTECSPVITVSTLDYRAPGFFQPGSKRGSVGQPLPGVVLRVVDAETREQLPPGKAGLVLVKGPNVMQGYLAEETLTREVLRDGWYVTGDIGMVDEDGFLYITDRLARFSKIGGEMVPHGKVEEALHEAAGEQAQAFAVTSIADEKKGERLAVLHTIETDRLPAILGELASRGLPNLFIPRPEQFVKVEQLPLLGTGKVDLRAARRIASEAAARAKR
jgi:acyl-[acyl-carrier-protein]-phospholipid O-acyltransferase/long-chain-fatty-acid--[acyl-carrier-protein] ligase